MKELATKGVKMVEITECKKLVQLQILSYTSWCVDKRLLFLGGRALVAHGSFHASSASPITGMCRGFFPYDLTRPAVRTPRY